MNALPITERSCRIAPRGRESGLSLVELMVAMVLSLLLIAGVIQIFVSSSATYSVNEAMARAQENARFATRFLGRDVQLAGYSGCGRGGVTRRINVLADPVANDLPDDVLAGVSITGDIDMSALDDRVSGVDVVESSDGVTVYAADGQELFMPEWDDDTDSIQLAGDAEHIEKGDLVVVGDCSQADVFSVTGVSSSGSGEDATTDLGHAGGDNQPTSNVCPERDDGQLCRDWGVSPSVQRVGAWTFFIGESNGRRALYRAPATGNGAARSLVEGVESLRIRYGVVESEAGFEQWDQAREYVAADAVDNWEDVVSVKIELVVSGGEQVPDAGDQTFPVFGDAEQAHDVTEEDRLMRRVSRDITLRNRTR